MSILVGIKISTIHSSSNDSDGYSCSSDEITNMTIIKEGTTEELDDYVKEQLIDANNALKMFDELDDEIEFEHNMTKDAYNAKLDKAREMYKIKTFDQVLILEGKIVFNKL
jgi:hypothetical protein